MAASHEMVAPDVARIQRVARQFQATEIVLTTNKRVVMWCADRASAKSLAVRISEAGYWYEVKPGLQSSAWYVQALL